MNRIVDNFIIVDSAMGNAFILTSAGQIVNCRDLKVATIAFWSIDTTGNCIISAVDTTNHVIHFQNPNNNPTTVGAVLGGVYLKDLKIPTLTAGSAWLYLK